MPAGPSLWRGQNTPPDPSYGLLSFVTGSTAGQRAVDLENSDSNPYQRGHQPVPRTATGGSRHQRPAVESRVTRLGTVSV
jgi:hypothetical protein